MRRRLRLSLGLLVAATWASSGVAHAQVLPFFSRAKADQWQRLRAAALVPLDQVPPQYRDAIRTALERPTLFTSGPGEQFLCRPELYQWFLDHPDRAVVAWRRLGATCLSITDRGGGCFGWADDQGNDVSWEVVHDTPEVRVWFAHGKVKPTAVLPPVSVQAVVVLRHNKAREQADGTVMFQQADVFAHTDSKTAALVTRLMGPSAPRLAEQGVTQMQMFFSALAWYCQRYPERAATLLGANPFGPPPAAAPPAAGRHPDNG